jgi:hypothetical protein
MKPKHNLMKNVIPSFIQEKIIKLIKQDETGHK